MVSLWVWIPALFQEIEDRQRGGLTMVLPLRRPADVTWPSSACDLSGPPPV